MLTLPTLRAALELVYAGVLVLLAVYGFRQALLAGAALALWLRRRRAPAPPAAPAQWPSVLVQLPLYNERYVALRLLDAVAALDYPRDRLHLQVLDDSTDSTSALVRARVQHYRRLGVSIEHRRRKSRAGYKAGALAAGLRGAPGELVAIFDADFVPAPDFLRRTVPEFAHDPRLAALQTRWEHLNVDYSPLTQAEGLALDGYFGVEQWVIDQLGLMLSFNGSGGVWRRAAIDDAGGWQGDTLAEDLDLSYRAHLRGWRLRYRPHLSTPAELPTTMLAFKRQQFRWATGTLQVARKLGGRLLRARLSLLAKLEAWLHLLGYLPHPLMIAALLLSLPLMLVGGQLRLPWQWLGLAGLGPILMSLVPQVALRRDWRRLVHVPALILVGIGMAVSTSLATVQTLLGRPAEFLRTPKGQPSGAYAIALDGTVWAEAFLALYALVTGLLALDFAPGMAPMAFLYAIAFGYTAVMGLWPVERAQARAAVDQRIP